MRTKVEIESRFERSEALAKCQHFLFVGIGGAGMKPIAQRLVRLGKRVSGVDETESPNTIELRATGIDVEIGSWRSSEIPDALVLSDAIDLDKDETVKRAAEIRIPLFRRSQIIQYVLADKEILAVTGTHGKSTTSGMLSYVLHRLGQKCPYLVGADIGQLSESQVDEGCEFAVVEACEAYDAIRDIFPHSVILTNLELDHEDFHESYETLRDSVTQFVSRIPQDGTLCVSTDKGAQEVKGLTQVKTRTYDQIGPECELTLFGDHNRQNAAGVIELLASLGFEGDEVLAAVKEFGGVGRRLEVVEDRQFEGPGGRITVVDDYAHHPTEIAASLSALRSKYPNRRIVCVYQPHLYSRTQGSFVEFAEALDLADVVVLTDIYPAREKPIPGVSSFRIAELIRSELAYVPSRHLLPIKVQAMAKADDVIVLMGAGNISDLVRPTIKLLDRGQIKKVAVIFGGEAAEREISIHSSLSVQEALSARYEVDRVDLTELILSGQSFNRLVGENRPDVAILAIHGTGAEDGRLQGLLDLLHIPYTGSDLLSSAIAMDKQKTKDALAKAGLPVPQGWCVSSAADLPKVGGTVIVKPNSQGSTVGLTIVENPADLESAVRKALQYDSSVLIEEFVEGREVTVPVLGDRALPIIEIAPEQGGYDFANKYVPGRTNKICPAQFDLAATERMQTLAVKAHQALGCSGVTRTDMIVTDRGPVILEVNTLPGMTSTSLVSMSAKVSGLEFIDFLEWMMKDAVERFNSKHG